MDGNEVASYSLDNPNGEIITVDYKYVDDPTINPPLSSLPVGLPISKEVKNGSTKIVGQYFEYTNPGNIKSAYRYNKGGGTHFGGPSYVPTEYELDISFLTDQGRPTQVRGKDGVITSYIWGCNDQYPVAKIIGLSYALIPSGTIMTIKNLSVANPYNEASLITALNGLRTSFPSAQVATYTYNPMVGTSTITDPKGVRIEYIYDDLGRLEYVRDQELNILGKNEYNYKN